MKIYGLLEGGIGVYALLLPLLMAGTEPLFRIVYQNIGTSFYAFSLLRFVICGLLLLVSARMNFGNLLLRQKKYQQAIAGYLLKKLTG